MSRGGAREGAGRKAGVPNRANAEMQAEIAATGETPLQYMVRVMRDEAADAERRDDMAKACAPYVHPKLANIEHGGKDGNPLQVEIVRFSDVSKDSPAE